MSLRAAWRAWTARRAKINQQLADVDATIPGRLDRWDRQADCTDDVYDRILTAIQEAGAADEPLDGWVDFTSMRHDGTTVTPREFLCDDITEGDVGKQILVGDGEGSTAVARILSFDGGTVRLRVLMETFEAS